MSHNPLPAHGHTAAADARDYYQRVRLHIDDCDMIRDMLLAASALELDADKADHLRKLSRGFQTAFARARIARAEGSRP